MNGSKPQDERADAVDAKLMELIEAHRSAMDDEDFAEADHLGAEVLTEVMAAALAAAERGEVDEDLVWQSEASECEQRGDWDGALAARQKVLELAQQDTLPAMVWKAHDDLADLYYLLGDHEAALREQQLATAAARNDDTEIVLRMALEGEATLLLRLGRVNEAAARVLEGLKAPNTEPVDDFGPAKLRVLQAQCEAECGHVAEAREVLRSVQSIVRRAEQMPVAAGYQFALCSWWWVEALCCETEDDTGGQIEALRRALGIVRHVAQDPPCSNVYCRAKLVRILDRLGEALWHHGDFDEARRVREESREIRDSLRLPDTTSKS